MHSSCLRSLQIQVFQSRLFTVVKMCLFIGQSLFADQENIRILGESILECTETVYGLCVSIQDLVLPVRLIDVSNI